MIYGMNSLAPTYKPSVHPVFYRLYPGHQGADRMLFYFLLALPVVNAIGDSTIYYFKEADAGGGMHPGIIRGIILIIFILLFGYQRIRDNKPTRYILAFLAYLFILTLFSSDVRLSFLSGYIKWFIPLMMFPVGVYFFRNTDQLLALNKAYVWGAMLVCINLAVAQFTDFGISAYVEESFYTGGAGVGITNQLALILLTYPFLIRQRKKTSLHTRWMIYIVGFISLIFVLIAMKRAGIISLLAGTLIYLYLTQSRARFIRYFIIVIILFYLVFPAFQSVLAERYNARLEQMQNIEDEARYQEFFFVLKEFREGDIAHRLFGSELFNSGSTFGRKYFHSSRIIHSDLSSFFYGAGLIGLALYISVFVLLLRNGAGYRRILRMYPVDRELYAIYFALLLATFLISVSGSGTIGERCLAFLYLGAVTGLSGFKMYDRSKSKD